jgi:hypothetical protein
MSNPGNWAISDPLLGRPSPAPSDDVPTLRPAASDDSDAAVPTAAGGLKGSHFKRDPSDLERFARNLLDAGVRLPQAGE